MFTVPCMRTLSNHRRFMKVESDECDVPCHTFQFLKLPPKEQLTTIPFLPFFLADDNAVRVPVGDVASGDEPAPRSPASEQRPERGGHD